MTNVTREERNQIKKGEREKVDVIDTVYDKVEEDIINEEWVNKQRSTINSHNANNQRTTANKTWFETQYQTQPNYRHRYKFFGNMELVLTDKDMKLLTAYNVIASLMMIVGGLSNPHLRFLFYIGMFLIILNKTVRNFFSKVIKNIPDLLGFRLELFLEFLEKLPSIIRKCLKVIGVVLLAIGGIALSLLIKRGPLYLILKALKK